MRFGLPTFLILYLAGHCSPLLSQSPTSSIDAQLQELRNSIDELGAQLEVQANRPAPGPGANLNERAIYENAVAAAGNEKKLRDLRKQLEAIESSVNLAQENAIMLRVIQAELGSLRLERSKSPLLDPSEQATESSSTVATPSIDPAMWSASTRFAQGNAQQAAWLFFAALCVFLMIIGFAVREIGLSHARNGVNAVMKGLLTLSIGMATFVFVGFPLMFGVGLDWITSTTANNSIWSFWLLQSGFVVVAAGICSGATGERTRFGNFLLVILIFTGAVYPLLAQFAWGSRIGFSDFTGSPGWLENLGFVDFGGSAVIHGIGGAFALAGIMILGPRHERFSADGAPKVVTGHSLPQAAVGTLLVWLGWFGLGLGQTLVAGYEIEAVGRIAVNFAIAAAGGSVFASLSIWRHRGRSDLNFALNGILAGLVSISASADQVHPLAALLIGGIAGLFAAWGIAYLENRQLDDVVGAVPVHLYAGVWGVLAVSLVGPFRIEFFLVQLLGVTTICGLAFLIGILVFKAVEIGLGLRASDEDQAAGLDFSEHATTAYPEFDLQES